MWLKNALFFTSKLLVYLESKNLLSKDYVGKQELFHSTGY